MIQKIGNCEIEKATITDLDEGMVIKTVKTERRIVILI